MFAINGPAEGGDGSAKVFTLEDFIFVSKQGERLPYTPTRVLQDREIACLDIRWRFQKNGNNSQIIKFA
eukprot:1436190-Ditylum_brightwellii.AAC.1